MNYHIAGLLFSIISWLDNNYYTTLNSEHVTSLDLIADNLRSEVNSLKQNNRNLETQIISDAESNIIKDLRKQQKIVRLNLCLEI